MTVFTSVLISIISKLHSCHYKILVLISTNDIKLLEPINEIIMAAIYQHFHELMYMVLPEHGLLVNGLAVFVD